MSVPDFDPPGPIQARIAVACSGARSGGALLGLSDEGRRRTSAWVLGVSLMPPMRRLRRGLPRGGGASPPPVSAASRGPGSQSPPWLSPFPTAFKGVGLLHDTTDLGPSVLFDHVARKIARRENLRGLGAAGREERHRRARAPPARRRNRLHHASASRAFPVRSARATWEDRAPPAAARARPDRSQALAHRNTASLSPFRVRGTDCRMCKGRKGPVHTRHARGDAGGVLCRRREPLGVDRDQDRGRVLQRGGSTP